MTDQPNTKAGGLQVYLRLLSYVRPYWHFFAMSIFGYLLFALSQPMFPKLVDYFIRALEKTGTDITINLPWLDINHTIAMTSEDMVFLVPAGVVFIGIFRGIGSFLGSFFLAKVSLGVVHDLRLALFERLTVLPNSYIDNNNSGHLISRITYNVTQVTGAATDAIKVIFREGMTVIALLGYLIWTNWQLSMVFVAIAPVIALTVTYTSRRFKKISKKLQLSMGDVTHITSETITNFRVVRGFGGEDYEVNRFRKATLRNKAQSLKLVRVGAIHTPTLQLLVLSALATLMYVVLMANSSGLILSSASELVGFITAAGLLPKPIRQLSEVFPNIQKGIAAAESIFEQVDEPSEQDLGEHKIEQIEGEMEIRNLNFTYPGADKQALTDISFKIMPGETVALVGRSGSGKTTLASLLPRFYNHSEGDILLDGIPVTDYQLANLRHHIALVTQHVTLFNDTVAGNIAYGDLRKAPEEDIRLAARAAYAMEFIDNLPHGFDTLIGENGVLLSGGQRQRLAIARAILKDAPVLILDEATSALDTESERHIQGALDSVMKNRTTLVIAHRLSTIENADQILVMDQGQIIERGSHQELLDRDGAYARLYHMQFKEQADISA